MVPIIHPMNGLPQTGRGTADFITRGGRCSFPHTIENEHGYRTFQRLCRTAKCSVEQRQANWTETAVASKAGVGHPDASKAGSPIAWLGVFNLATTANCAVATW